MNLACAESVGAHHGRIAKIIFNDCGIRRKAQQGHEGYDDMKVKIEKCDASHIKRLRETAAKNGHSHYDSHSLRLAEAKIGEVGDTGTLLGEAKFLDH